MPSEGPFLPGAVKQTNLGQPARLRWDIFTAVQAEDGIVATCTPSPQTYRSTFKLWGTNFGFEIPEGNSPVGVELTFHCKSTNGGFFGACGDGIFDLMLGDTVIGQIDLSSTTADWSLTLLDTRTVGGAAEDWGATLTREIVNDPTFGVRIEARVPEDQQASIDWMKLAVTYEELTSGSSIGSGGAGVGGASSLTKAKYIGTGGAGVGGHGFDKWASVGTGGAGVGGAGVSRRIGKLVGSGGVGVGYGNPHTMAKSVGSGGAGAGGFGGFRNEMHDVGSGGAGVGGSGLTRISVAGIGGAGVGGSGASRKSSASVGTGGVGAGYADGIFSRKVASAGEGGVGVGYAAGVVTRKQSTIGSGGVGAGGAGQVRNVISPNPEDEIERRHRGQVTRRMVFDAILKAIVRGPLNSYRAYLSDDEPDMNEIPPGDTFAVIIPGSAENDQGDLAGGGDLGTMRTDSASVRVYSSNSTDQYARATQWNLKFDKGAMERARQIRRTLKLLDLADDAGWLLLTEPMRPTTTNKGRFRRVTPKWGYYEETFEVKYTEYLG